MTQFSLTEISAKIFTVIVLTVSRKSGRNQLAKKREIILNGGQIPRQITIYPWSNGTNFPTFTKFFPYPSPHLKLTRFKKLSSLLVDERISRSDTGDTGRTVIPSRRHGLGDGREGAGRTSNRRLQTWGKT